MQHPSSARGRHQRLTAALVVAGLAAGAGSRAAAAPAPPSGPHPRLFLSAKVRASLVAAAMIPKSSVANVIARCQDGIDKPKDVTDSGYQGDNWSNTAAACALAWQVTSDPKYATLGVTLWKALLEDVSTLGDKKACVAGADDATAIMSIRRDSGYAIRTIGPNTALAYDWLYDAPGVTEAFRAQSRACFRSWVNYYTTMGYLRTEPGANYHAGYVAAKTLISIAEAGEDGADSDRFWTETVDDIFGTQIITNGLATDTAGVPTGLKRGALVGGDWAEGWQYGPLSVLEYSYASRALIEQGVDLAPLAAWNGALTLRDIYGLLPDGSGQYVGGDFEAMTAFSTPQPSPLDATLLGSSNDQSAGWAAFTLQKFFAKSTRDSFWQALADTRGATPADPSQANLPLWYLARGTRNLYTRSSWGADAFWAVLTSGPRLVDDHQHMDASNFVFTRGGDPLIVDPSPYGARCTLTSNALSVDSNIVTGDYAPSQTPWSTADMPLARGTKSGVVAARADIAKAFNTGSKPSDVTLARRDWVFLPEGEIVTIDRATTPSATSKLYLRFRTTGTLAGTTTGPLVASATIGGSQLAIHAVTLKPATPPVIRATVVADSCTDPFGACRVSRLPTTEYSYEVPGPDVLAVHVLDGLAKAEALADVAPMDAVPIDTTPAQNAGVVGASVYRTMKQTFVLEPATLPAPASLTYGVPGTNPSRHVVFDAPVDGSGMTAVTATAQGGRCVLTLTAGAGVTGNPTIFTLASAADGCTVSEDADVKPGTVSPGSAGFDKPAGGGPAAGATGAGPSGAGTSGGGSGSGGSGQTTGAQNGGAVSGGCGCALGTPGTTAGGLAAGLAGLLLAVARRGRRRRSS